MDSEEIDYIRTLLLGSRSAGEIKPKLTLKLIIGNVMEKFNIEESKAIENITEVMDKHISMTEVRNTQN